MNCVERLLISFALGGFRGVREHLVRSWHDWRAERRSKGNAHDVPTD